jgi:hypothetical protein
MSESITGRDPFNTSKAMRVLAFALLCFLIAAPLRGQKEKREPLTEAQQDQVAEAGIDPVARIDLYVKFLNEHADTIKGLIPRAHSSARNSRLENELEDFTALMDELGDNLDLYSDRKADLRKSLKGLNEGVERWQQLLNSLPSEPAFEVARKDALESSGDLSTQAKQITTDQDNYFKEHKDEKGQDRAEPK